MNGSLLATGLYCPEPPIVRSLRDEISVNGDSFLDAIALADGFTPDTSSALKRLPKGFESIDERWSKLIRLRDFSIYKIIDSDFIFEPNLLERAVAV